MGCGSSKSAAEVSHLLVKEYLVSCRAGCLEESFLQTQGAAKLSNGLQAQGILLLTLVNGTPDAFRLLYNVKCSLTVRLEASTTNARAYLIPSVSMM